MTSWRHGNIFLSGNTADNTIELLFNFDLAYVLLSLNGVVGPRIALVRKAEVDIGIEDSDARGPEEGAVTDYISVAQKVPMRMADPELHGPDMPTRFECLCGGPNDCVFCRDSEA